MWCIIQSKNLPFDPKINRGPPWVMVYTCLKYHHFMSKGDGVTEMMQTSKYKLDLWLRPFDPRFNRGLPLVMGNTFVKYHHCMSKRNEFIVRKPFFHRQNDGWTDSHGETSILPLPLQAGRGPLQPLHLYLQKANFQLTSKILNEHVRSSVTFITAPALSNSPQ